LPFAEHVGEIDNPSDMFAMLLGILLQLADMQTELFRVCLTTDIKQLAAK